MKQPPDLVRAARSIRDFLEAIGAPVDTDPELRHTGERVAAAFANELLAGYAQDPAEILADSTHSESKGLVILRDVATTVVCPHHLLPASGKVHLGYLPGERVVGFGALAQLVDCCARRLILQEDLAAALTCALVEHLGAQGAGAVVDLAPTCVTARGERSHAARAVTTSFAGSFERDALARTEFLTTLALGRANESATRTG